ncbi:Molybdopterin oxidoreductase subunit [Acidisarcina polymorpha]|uniref:Molybdopterin oxidoreductase subunit n=1 Tax=Acidisarcina polymorpha TaxID=2211140 RepID=A0A2Z5FVV5_9BACT|nr:cytochrome c3 family protein [Acidisarcina polymorpha]AXC10998.1 Molybdopterin oxidoreductase subunit [Acidisarcina polymorpha]
MAQIFDRSSNALARASLVLTGLIVIALGVTLDQLQRSPWVTRQGQRADQPVPFSHKHHVMGLGIQCQYCHTSVEKSSYAGIPPTKTCMNCHSQIWTNANLLEPVRHSWATGESITWTKVHDLPDYAYFNHEIHVNKGLGCSSCHGRVDLMPIMYQQNTLQMEWCLNCHRNPAKNLRPTSEIYNMAWTGPSTDSPVWCGSTESKSGVPTAQTVSCTTLNPAEGGVRVAALQMPEGAASSQITDPGTHQAATVSDSGAASLPLPPVTYVKFTDQDKLGHYLADQYHIRTPRELSSCEVCHR